MTYTLERKDHDLNLAKAKSNSLEQGELHCPLEKMLKVKILRLDHKDAFDTLIVGLQTEVKTLKSEKEKLKTLWLESQKLLVCEQSKYTGLLQENDMLQV